jgi:hypothetical protein
MGICFVAATVSVVTMVKPVLLCFFVLCCVVAGGLDPWRFDETCTQG